MGMSSSGRGRVQCRARLTSKLCSSVVCMTEHLSAAFEVARAAAASMFAQLAWDGRGGETMKFYRFEAVGPNGRLKIHLPRHLTDLDRPFAVDSRLGPASDGESGSDDVGGAHAVSIRVAGRRRRRPFFDVNFDAPHSGPARVTRSRCAPLSRRGNCEMLCMKHAPHVYSDAGHVLNVGTWTPVR